MNPYTIAVLETTATRILGNHRPNATLLRVARGFSRRVRVLTACWHQMDVGEERPKLHPPFLEYENGECRVWSPLTAVDVDAIWHFPVAGNRRTALTREERDAEVRFEKAGIRCVGIPADNTARILYAQARRAIPTNAAGPLGRLGRKDQLEYGLRWYARASGRRLPRPETHPSIGAQLSTTLGTFGGRDCIVKPVNSGGGRGIHIVAGGGAADDRFDPAARYVVQELERDPLVLDGLKADLRCYLLVTTAGGRARSRRVGPVLVRSAPVPYQPLLSEAEITNTSYRRRLGLAPSIRPLEVALSHDPALCSMLRTGVEGMCEDVLDFVFAWRDEFAATDPPPAQAMLWGIDLLSSGHAGTRKLQLLEINIYPQLHRDDETCDALVDTMLTDDYLPELLRPQSRIEAQPQLAVGAR
jgi:hypothetical protein